MKISNLAMAAALALAAPAFAASHDHDAGYASSASASTHQLANNFTGALHKLGNATRHVFHRADASLHRMGKHDSDRTG